MKKIIILFVACTLVFANVYGGEQKAEKAAPKKRVEAFRTVIYTDKTLGAALVPSNNINRGFGAGVVAALGNAALGVATGYMSSLVDLGIQAIGQLITMDRRHKQEWHETVMKECTYTNSVGTLYALNDFYANGSDRGTLDPTGIQFNGVGCLATVGEDTAFYVSCHLNREKLHRLMDHSKFELTLDTVVINPYHSHLPNTTLPIPFSFADRKTFNFKMKIQILSSWMDFTPALHKDEVLGEFVLNIAIDSADVNERGEFVYVRPASEPSQYELAGESFIVPRSYMQVIDPIMGFHAHYGTGQYSVNVLVEETCELSAEYQKHWRADRKMRKKLIKSHKKVSFDDVCKKITRQTWDEALQAWVVTILKAPADYSVKTLNEMLKITPDQIAPSTSK